MATCIWHGQWWHRGMAIAATSGVFLWQGSGVAQIAPDRTLGAEGSVVNPNVVIKGLPSDRIDGGAVRGANLFHSFKDFNVGAGRGVYFSNPAGVENILSRVTGGNASNILGRLGVLGNANLFLLNPNGIIFGPGASLDLRGSFVASTGNSLKLGNGAEFSATNPGAPPLLTVSVPLGVQFGKDQPRAIVNAGNLAVETGQNLMLLGGTVASTGQLSAPGGQVAIAAVPSHSVVNLSPSVQLLRIDTPSSVPGVGSAQNVSPTSTVAELLAGRDGAVNSGLTVSSDGQVVLAGSGLPVADGDVVARNVTAQTATLSANHNLTLVESQLRTTGDLNLLARDTVRVRDSVANPFLAQAGGQLLVQGNQNVDIFALNHPSSGLISGGDMVLRSANTVGGDAHYWTGGNFRIERLDGSLGGLFSPYDPVIRASGDVSFDSYTGASLHIFAGGSVTINGTVEITGADSMYGLPAETVPLSDGTSVTIDGTKSPTLDIRAGIAPNKFNFNPTGLIPGNASGFTDPNPIPNPNGAPTSANITIGTIINRIGGGQVFLTNQYQPNLSLPGGSIQITVKIPAPPLDSYSVIAYSNPVTIDARGNVRINGINTGAGNTEGGDINIISGGNIDTYGGKLESFANEKKGGDISLNAYGKITTGDIKSYFYNQDVKKQGNGGNITLKADGNITTKEISSFVFKGNNGNGGNITMTSKNGQIDTREGTISSKSSEGDGSTNRGRAGNVTIRAASNIRSGGIEASSNSNDISPYSFSQIKLESLQGTVFLNSLNGVKLTTTNTGYGYAGDIIIYGKNIRITNTGRGDNQGIQSRGVVGRVFIQADNNVTIRNSRIDTQTLPKVTSSLKPSEGDGIRINAGKIEIDNSELTAATNSAAPPGSITLTATDSVDIKNYSRISIQVSNKATSPAQEINFTPSITIEGTSVNITDSGKLNETTQISASSFNSSREAGNVIVNAHSVLLRGNGRNNKFPTGLFAQANQPNSPGTAGNILNNSAGTAGNIRINTDDIRVENGATIIVESGTGKAGNITINTDDIRVKNGTISVSSGGQAGNLIIYAKKLFLDNGKLLATTGKSDSLGANIILLGKGTTQNALEDLLSQIANNQLGKKPLPGSSLQHLRLQNESLIAANAKNNASGGNVAIKTQVLLALPPTGENGSDITANAQQGRGGVVAIDSRPLGVYGIEFRTKPTPLNDITASSLSGPQGIVTIDLPDVDPSRGLVKLPENLGDSSKLITQSCPIGGQRAASRFVVTGRGGLPPNPSSALSSDTLVGDAPAIASSPENSRNATSSTDSTSVAPVEAQGVKIGPKGEFILTARPSTPSPHRSWQRFRGCDGE